MAAFSSAAQLRRRPAPVNTSTRRARSDTCISSEIDIGRSSKPAPNIIPFTPGAGRCSPDDAYVDLAVTIVGDDTRSADFIYTWNGEAWNAELTVLSGLAPLPLADGTWSGIGPPLTKRGG